MKIEIQHRAVTTVVAGLIVASLTAPPAVAVASATKPAKRHCAVDLTVGVGGIAPITGTPPQAGSSEWTVSLVDGQICGRPFHGATRGIVAFAGPNSFTVHRVIYGPNGSFKMVYPGTGVDNPDGSRTTSGSGTISHGTGSYKGAHGTMSFDAHKPPGGTLTVRITGSFKY